MTGIQGEASCTRSMNALVISGALYLNDLNESPHNIALGNTCKEIYLGETRGPFMKNK
jgi:hypothetical protein